MFKLRERFSNKSLNILHHYGNIPIKQIKIFRYPLSDILHKAVSLVSSGNS